MNLRNSGREAGMRICGSGEEPLSSVEDWKLVALTVLQLAFREGMSSMVQVMSIVLNLQHFLTILIP
jgi:hypothetical protein